jgi:hypothetical protein
MIGQLTYIAAQEQLESQLRSASTCGGARRLPISRASTN